MAIVKDDFLYSYLSDTWFVAKKLCDFLGKRMLSLLCVTDALVDVVLLIHQGDTAGEFDLLVPSLYIKFRLHHLMFDCM